MLYTNWKSLQCVTGPIPYTCVGLVPGTVREELPLFLDCAWV